ncbi:MAG: glycerate kinase [Elusimicrobia bacterium]|nr:glycerate kinase [Elusimicrobiota bacterium]
MRILLAPNAFKGSLTALEAAKAMEQGVRRVLPRSRTILLPLSDGGDGLMEVLLQAKGGRRICVPVFGPLGEKRRAAFALLKSGAAVVEMAQASGLALVCAHKRDPLGATSYGTGQLIATAIQAGAKAVAVGLGGSATNDGGAGMAQALGARLLDKAGQEIGPGVEALLRLEKIDVRALRQKIKGVRISGIADVANPLLGPRGSARVYGPQKGATPRMVRIMEEALARYARIIERDLGVSVGAEPGAGAAGGLGAGLLAFLKARIRPGADYVLDAVEADENLAGTGLVMTGEGRLDRTSFFGKAPVAMARRAKAKGIPVAVVCASLETGIQARLRREGISEAVTLAQAGAGPEDSYSRASFWVSRAASLAVKKILLAAGLFCVPQAWPAHAGSGGFSPIDDAYFHRDRPRNLEKSLELCDKALAENPEDAQALWRKGRSLVRLGEREKSSKDKLRHFKRAEEALRAAIASKSKEAEAHFWLGIALGRRGQTQGIFKSLFLVGPIREEMRRTLELDPRHGGAHHVLGEMYFQIPGGRRKKELSARELEEAVRLSPNYTAHYVPLARVYEYLGEKDKAVAALRRVSEIKDPEDPAEYPENLKEAEEALRAGILSKDP